MKRETIAWIMAPIAVLVIELSSAVSMDKEAPMAGAELLGLSYQLTGFYNRALNVSLRMIMVICSLTWPKEIVVPNWMTRIDNEIIKK